MSTNKVKAPEGRSPSVSKSPSAHDLAREKKRVVLSAMGTLFIDADKNNWDFLYIPHKILYSFVESRLARAGSKDADWSKEVPSFIQSQRHHRNHQHERNRVLEKRERNLKSNGDKNVDAKVQPPELPDAPSSENTEKVDVVTVTEGYVNAKIETVEARIASKLEHLPSTTVLISTCVASVFSAIGIFVAISSFGTSEYTTGMQSSMEIARNRTFITSSIGETTQGIVANKQAIGRLEDDAQETKKTLNLILEVVTKIQAQADAPKGGKAKP